jgi:hypothetical protein
VCYYSLILSLSRMLRKAIEQILPPQYYTRNMVGAKVDQSVMIELLAWKLPKVFLDGAHTPYSHSTH